MVGLTSLEVNNSVFNITEENNKIELYTFPVSKIGGVTYEKVKGEIEKVLDISDITATDLQDEIIGPIVIEEYRNQVPKRLKDEQCTRILSFYVRSIFQDFESFFRTEIGLVEDDIKLVLDEHISSFIANELPLCIHTFKDISEFLAINIQRENDPSRVLDIEFDDTIMKTKLVIRKGIIAIKFDQTSFFTTIFGFSPN